MLKIKPESDQASSNYKYTGNTRHGKHTKWQHEGIISKIIIFRKLYRIDDPVSLKKKIKKGGGRRKTDINRLKRTKSTCWLSLIPDSKRKYKRLL